MGKFSRILEPGLNFLIPFLDKIKYVQSLKEVAVAIETQSAITKGNHFFYNLKKDNVTLQLDGVLYYKVISSYKVFKILIIQASYGVEDSHYSITQLAQTTMRSEIGKMTLDNTLSQRTELNTKIVEAINLAAENWGIVCLRYEIRKFILMILR